MKYNLIALACAFLLAAGLSFSVTAGPAQDADTDGVPDSSDDCVVVPNADQADSDQDGYGNKCDADYDNTGLVGTTDFGVFKTAWNTSSPTYNEQTDHDCTGLVGTTDFGIFKSAWNSAPGPSGLACAGTVKGNCPTPSCP
jgi:hypothetical protein